MGLFDKVFGKNKSSDLFTEDELLGVEVCPNCWGRLEYDNQYLTYVADQTKDQINHDKQHQKAFIQKFVQTNITGIRLKAEGDYLTCPACKTKYKRVSSKAN